LWGEQEVVWPPQRSCSAPFARADPQGCCAGTEVGGFDDFGLHFDGDGDYATIENNREEGYAHGEFTANSQPTLSTDALN
jgi:hypothetical protein